MALKFYNIKKENIKQQQKSTLNIELLFLYTSIQVKKD